MNTKNRPSWEGQIGRDRLEHVIDLSRHLAMPAAPSEGNKISNTTMISGLDRSQAKLLIASLTTPTD